MAAAGTSEGEFQATLGSADKLLYKKKLEYINAVDPYLIQKSFDTNPDSLPKVTYIDILNYLVFSPNPVHTHEEMKAYKGLEAHNQFTSGWVRDVTVAYPKENIAVITGRVSKVHFL